MVKEDKQVPQAVLEAPYMHHGHPQMYLKKKKTLHNADSGCQNKLEK